MAWTPRRDSEAGSAEDVQPSPSPRRRRRAPEPATPTLDKMEAKSPRVHTGERRRGGVNTADQPQRGEDQRKRDIKIRLGKRWAEIFREVKAGEMTWAEFVEGLDEQELARGQLRSNDGTFTGRPPQLVPREFHLACQREMKRRFEEIFQVDVLKVARQYLRMAQDEDLKPEVRAKMLQYAMERIFGGIPKELKVTQEAPWEQMVVNVIGEDGGPTEMPAHLSERYARYTERQGGGIEE